MKGSETMYYLTVFFMITTSPLASAMCGMFHFLSPSIQNGTLVVKENTTLNITFKVLNKHCSTLPFGAFTIDISLWDTNKSMFARQCTIHTTCTNGSEHANTSCQCLGTQGIYGFQLVVQRQHSTKWKWSTSTITTNDTFIDLSVTYPPRITQLTVEGYDDSIPILANVSVSCSWQDGNPPSSVSLLDRNDNLLARGNNSGRISYAFPLVKCNDSGAVRCKADGSDISMSSMMLIECPLEIVIPLPKIRSGIVGQNTEVTFPIHSHTSNITACHMTQLNRKKNINDIILKKYVNINDLIRHEGYMSLETRSCEYDVIGVPPKLHLSIKLRNMKTEEEGLWYVNVSNNMGSDVMLIHVHIINPETVNIDSNVTHLLTSGSEGLLQQDIVEDNNMIISGVVLGGIAFTVIVFVIIYYIKKGRGNFTKLKKKRHEDLVVFRPLGTDKEKIVLSRVQVESRVYYEIKDTENQTDLCSTATENITEMKAPHSHDFANRVQLQTMNENWNKYTDSERLASGRINANISPNASGCTQHEEEISKNSVSATPDYPQSVATGSEIYTSGTTAGYLKSIQTGSETSVSDVKTDPHRVPTFDKTSKILARQDHSKHFLTERETGITLSMPEYLQLIQLGTNIYSQTLMADYLNLIQRGKETGAVPAMPDYLMPVLNGRHASNLTMMSDYLKLIPRAYHANNIANQLENLTQAGGGAHLSDYLQPIETGSDADNVVQLTDYQEPIQNKSEGGKLIQLTDYKQSIQTGSETGNVVHLSDYEQTIQTGIEKCNAETGAMS